MSLFPQPVPIASAEASLARWILESYTGLSLRHAIHAAVVTTQHLNGIVTADTAIAQVRGLTVFDSIALASELSCWPLIANRKGHPGPNPAAFIYGCGL